MNHHTTQASATVRPKAKAPVLKNTLSEAVAAPTEKRGVVMLNFWGWCGCTSLRFWGVVGAIRKDARTASDVFLTTTLHPMRSKTQTVALVTPEGAKTMTTLHLASRRAAPNVSPTQHPADLVALHMTACNGLSAALHLLTSASTTEADSAVFALALARAMRATTALKRACAELNGGAA